MQVRVVTMETGKISMSPVLWGWNWLCEYELMTFSRERDRHGDNKCKLCVCVCVCLNSLLGIDGFGLKSLHLVHMAFVKSLSNSNRQLPHLKTKRTRK